MPILNPLVMNDQLVPEWLDADWLLGQFGTQRAAARRNFKEFVLQGVGLASPLLATKHQLLLGDDNFIKQHQATMQGSELRELSLAHKRSLALRLEDYAAQSARSQRGNGKRLPLRRLHHCRNRGIFLCALHDGKPRSTRDGNVI
ncbi:hypothetical protein EJG51_009145 [Undibacterium piscinae]|uniref:Uncharacterized protein n=1 Tax=Undibacterium piscinae TaxID=2495591 RepID=A0A6M4A5K5_9BURK|nr:hypothetical protein EJG51_009145 [Undibacterium piscinae]